MLRTFHFHEELAKLVGHETLQFDADTPLLLLSALKNQIPAIADRANTLKVGFLVKDGDQFVSPTIDQFSASFGDSTEIWVVTEIEGSGIEWAAVAAFLSSYGITSTILITIAYVAVNVAIGIAIGAVVAALAPTPGSVDSQRTAKADSFIWQGVENTVEQGRPVPLVFGTFLVGSTVVSTDVVVDEERLEAPTPPTSPAPVSNQYEANYGGGY